MRHSGRPHKRKHRYFVVHLNKEHAKRKQGWIFEIQILDSKGRTEKAGYIGYSETALLVEDHAVPRAVLEAARRQPEGQGDYVDESGKTIRPF